MKSFLTSIFHVKLSKIKQFGKKNLNEWENTFLFNFCSDFQIIFFSLKTISSKVNKKNYFSYLLKILF